jgi:hypothetical protein
MKTLQAAYWWIASKIGEGFFLFLIAVFGAGLYGLFSGGYVQKPTIGELLFPLLLSGLAYGIGHFPLIDFD